MEKTYTVKQVANILGYSTNSIYTFLKEGRIKGVRIGKGRFRVSQQELDKLLHLKKSQEVQPISMTSLVSPSIQSAPITSESEEIPSLDKHLEEINDNVPSLFDWFVSLTSIIIGFTMILFIHSFEEFSNIGLSQFLMPIKINLLIAGIGLFLVNVLNRARKNWHFIFNLVIILNLLVFSLMLFLSKDLLGFTIFALLPLMIFFHSALKLKGIIGFAIYVSLLTIILPIVLIISPSIIEFPTISFFSTWSPIQVAIFWLVIISTINGIIWKLRDKQKSLFWISLLIFDAGLVYFAYLYSAQLYWGRALIFILIFLTLIISSFWYKLNLKDEETRKTVTSIFGDLLLIFLAIISVIWVVQNNIRSYAQDELVNKLVYGGTLIDSTVKSSREKLITLSRDESLIEAVKKKDITFLNKSMKDFFIYSLNFRYIWMFDDKGEVLNIYPEVSVPYKNLDFRESFQVMKVSKKNYISDLFETEVSGEKKWVIAVMTPILDENENFIGALIGSLDVDSLANELQQFANSYDNEYFLVLDKEGKVIIKPENINGLSSKEIQQLLDNQTNNNYDVEQVIDSGNKLIQIHGQITDANWILILRRSLANTYNFNNVTNLLLNLIIISAGLLVIFWNIVHLKRRI
jgi:excisionase family DNA binding protein